nr:amyloid beta A4 precursor protein-binding family B member 1-interacting protein-like [Salvelinus alpinus]
MEDIDAMFTDLLGEMDLLTQGLGYETDPSEMSSSSSQIENNFSIGFTDLKASLNELEDHDLDALMADLESDLTETEETLNAAKMGHVHTQQHKSGYYTPQQNVQASIPSSQMSSSSSSLLPEPLVAGEAEAQVKADKIKLALEKLKEAKVKKLVIKVMMSDGSSKTLMVDERQTVRDVLDNLFEKTHCDCSTDWSLCETNPELQAERGFEDHEYLVEPLSAWTRDSENQILFLLRPNKYLLFKDPQTSRDLACFIQFDKVNIYTATDYKQKYKAPTDFCFILKHPQIQKESQYIRFLCCDDELTLSLWVNSIRVAKVRLYSYPLLLPFTMGAPLYHNYQSSSEGRALTTTSTLACDQSCLLSSPPTRSTGHIATVRANGHPDQDYLSEPPPDFIPPPPPGWGSGV